MLFTSFLREIAPYVVVVGSFGRNEESPVSDIDCFLRSRPRDEVDPELDNETYMPEILEILSKHSLQWSSELIGHVAIEQPGFPRMVEISSHYRIPCTEDLFFREVEGVQLLCARDDKECDLSNTYDYMDWDDELCDMVIRNPLPAFSPPAPFHISQRNSAANKEENDMSELSQKSQELFKFLQDAYIKDGYMYSGSWPYNGLHDRGFRMEDIEHLVAANLIQRRDCDAVAYELTVNERAKLLDLYGLGKEWLKNGSGIYDSIDNELRFVMKERTSKKPNILVKTLKHVEDVDKPAEAEVYSPFFIGQMLNIEYDIHRTMATGYARKHDYVTKATGLFMVTDIVCNMLIYPHENMVELTALDADFIKLYPDERSNLYYESIVVNRVREPARTLDTKIQEAQLKSAAAKDFPGKRTNTAPER